MFQVYGETHFPNSSKPVNIVQKGMDTYSGQPHHQRSGQVQDTHKMHTPGAGMNSVQGNHSISLVISSDKATATSSPNMSGSASSGSIKPVQHHHAGLVKVNSGGGGRSLPSSPLSTRLAGSNNSGAGGTSGPATTISIPRTTPPSIPPRQNHQHVSTTYLNQEKHTIHVIAPHQSGGGGKGSNGSALSSAGETRNGGVKEKPHRKRNDSLNPEITIDLVDGPVP